jgi:hypothetical protein
MAWQRTPSLIARRIHLVGVVRGIRGAEAAANFRETPAGAAPCRKGLRSRTHRVLRLAERAILRADNLKSLDHSLQTINSQRSSSAVSFRYAVHVPVREGGFAFVSVPLNKDPIRVVRVSTLAVPVAAEAISRLAAAVLANCSALATGLLPRLQNG